METVKAAEERDDPIVCIFGPYGLVRRYRLARGLPLQAARETERMERVGRTLRWTSGLSLEVRPIQIRTRIRALKKKKKGKP